MGAFFRSEEMTLCQLFLQSDAAYACVSELGEMGLVQFKDLNSDTNAFQRKFVNEIMRCEEMERKLRYIEKELKKDDMKVPDSDSNPKAPAPKEMIDLEATFEKIESELREVNTNAEALKKNFQELTELKEVLTKTQVFFREYGSVGGEQSGLNVIEDAQNALVQEERGGTAVQLGFIAGVIPREKVPAFERMLWFACRGNVFLRYDEITQALEDPHTGDEVHKGVFIVFFQGEQLKSRVRKICEGFRATLYPCPETAQERQEMLKGVNTRLEDLTIVLKQTKDHRHRVLVSAQKEIHNWIIKVKKIKAIYHTLNMCNFEHSRNNLIAECWTPVKVLDQVQDALRHGQEMSGSSVPNILHRMKCKETPPTYFTTNKFTKIFQSIVHSYGVAGYREVNPALYTIISFPFLFAVMFGDTGHGFIMFLFGLWLVVCEKSLTSSKNSNEIFKMMVGGRYIILLMGLFSLYTGVIYNDFFAKSINLFGTSWKFNYTQTTLDSSHSIQMKPEDMFDNVTKSAYPLGLDPIWQASINKITFTNSFKMKLSVILGVSQMLMGVFLSIFNHIHFRHYVYILVQFIPEVLFMLCIFGYLIALIFVKWITYNAHCASCTPSILIHFINMFLMKYTKPNMTEAYNCDMMSPTGPYVQKQLGCDSQTIFYPHQQEIQTALILVALLCIPILLLAKPFILRAQHNAKMRRKQALGATSHEQLVNNEELEGHELKSGENGKTGIEMAGVSSSHVAVAVSINGGTGQTAVTMDEHEEEEEKFDFGELFVGQAIHTIEYCLGCVSHTASYLRLWALSLAHAQLSEVLWGMLFRAGLKMDAPYWGGIIVWAVFGAFAVLTVCVLLVMEGLSAFLHTLRLHWVEFQSKFYHGDGYLFDPFNFKEQMDPTLEDK
ncbi:V-type proton ATPase 116 kDa subunit a 1-like isoform X2 [Dreissena polymorpha]|uniref:V-type proton ATPase 116 kDa subunit a 1-like isoform X2 n=1 Tax=Dreissena polymorpha TaxID=45954 RepID=UPI0022648F8A|nr:V-type proton ATPase 116 kDa subunit a 1-like isoform X2 [Dreissena polymorpha]